MRDSIKEAIGSTVQDMVDLKVKVSFTKKELNSLGIIVPSIEVTGSQIQSLRKSMNLSQSVFAKLLNVNAVRWIRGSIAIHH